MSLTSFISIPEVKNRLKQEYQTPKIESTQSIKVEPRTKSYGLTGTAFDYMMRFWIETVNPNAEKKEWVAETAVDLLESGELPATASVRKIAKRSLQEAKLCHSDYIRTGKINDDIISATILLAQLDPIYRALYLDPNMGKVDKVIVDEIGDMLKLVNRKDFTAKSYCALNPVFGQGSFLVGGADADLIIDDTLIDIKTTRSGKMDMSQFHQLLGYFILSQIGGVNNKKIRLNQLGIYFSRYGELVTFPAEIILNEKFGEIMKWFKKTDENTFNV